MSIMILIIFTRLEPIDSERLVRRRKFAKHQFLSSFSCFLIRTSSDAVNEVLTYRQTIFIFAWANVVLCLAFCIGIAIFQ